MRSLHFLKIHKQSWQRLWETLDSTDQAIVAGDNFSPLTEWFHQTVLTEATNNYNSLTFPYNSPETFLYAQS